MASIIDSTTSSAASEIAIDAMLAALRGASAEKIAEFRRLLHIDGAPVSLAPSGPKGTGSVGSSRVKNADIRVFPEWPLGDTEPTEEDYALPESLFQDGVCRGRVTDSTPDKRWSVAVYRWGQCNKPAVCDGLCAVCLQRQAAYIGKPGQWLGLVDEPVPSWAHFVGTDWFYKAKGEGKLFFNIGAAPPGSGAGSEPAASVASDDAKQKKLTALQDKVAAAKKAAEERAKKAADAKAAKEAEKLRVKTEAAELKAAAAKAVAAAKEKAKAAADALKAEAAAALKAAKAAAKPSVAKPVAAKPVPAAAAPVEEAEGEIVDVDGEIYGRKGEKLYTVDEDGVFGTFVGLIRGEGTEECPYTIEKADDEESA